MKILFFADVHGDIESLRQLKKKAGQVDYVACAGDITTMEHNIEEIIELLSSFPAPVLIIHGNHEDERNLKELAETHGLIFLHKAVHHVDDYVFLGYGGDGFSTNDPDFERVSERFFKPESIGKKRIILMTHGPAYDTKIDMIGPEKRGNKSYRKFINEVKPHLVVCGHLHEQAGNSHKIGRTLLINPGKNGAVVEI